MAVEELRRSTRSRKSVKSYAEEQAEEQAQEALSKPARKRKQPVRATAEESNDDAYNDEGGGGRTAKKVMRATSKTSTAGGASKPDWFAEVAEARVDKRLSKVKHLVPGQEERRLLPYIEDEDDLSDKYLSALKKVKKEKMFVLDRTRDVEQDCHANHDDCLFERLRIAGSNGNVYTLRISHLTTCDCPVAVWSRKGQETQCKHAIYALHKVLRAPDHLKYQQAFLTSELKELFANAPQLPSEVAEESVKDGNRKEVSGECPICFLDFEEDDDLVWCKAACGNNLHTDCFKAWERSKNPVTCPFCRAGWQNEVAKNSSKQKATIEEVTMPMGRDGAGGYYNVKNQLAY